MTCGHCEKSVKNAIGELDGVVEAKINLANGSAEVTFDETKVSEAQIKSAVNETGIYTAV